MGSKDRQIMAVLQADRRMNNQGLSERVSLSPSPCLRRLRQLDDAGVGRYPAAVVAPLALLAPVTGVVGSALVFGERFTSSRYAGMVLILAGLAVIVLRAPNRTVTPPVPSMK